MYTDKIVNVPKYLYINLCNSKEDKFFDISNLNKLEEFLYRICKNPLIVDFGYRSLKSDCFEDVYKFIYQTGTETKIHVKCQKELQKVQELSNSLFIPNLSVLFYITSLTDFLEYSKYAEQKFLFYFLKDMLKRTYLVGTVTIELYIDIKNIFCTYDVIKYFGQEGFKTRLIFMNRLGQGNNVADENISCSPVNFIKQDIIYRLFLDRLHELSNYILNINEIERVYNNPLAHCLLNRDCDFLSIDFDFKMMLCDKIFGDECQKLNPLDCIDEDGKLTDVFINAVKKDYKSMCYGCTCQNILDLRNERRQN